MSRRPRPVLLGAAAAVFAAGLSARLGFLLLDYAPVSDPAHNYNTALLLFREGTLLSDAQRALYVAVFPHLLGYDGLLAVSFALFGENLAAVVIPNILFDIASVIALYCLARALSENKLAPPVAAALWWLSPLNIAFCALSLPVVAVNALILAALAALRRVFASAERVGPPLLYSLLAGLALSALHIMRPFGVLLLLCAAAYHTLCLLARPRSGGLWLPLCKRLLSLAVTAAVFFALNAL
ncbi:MAG: hypothetical protein LBI44_02255 [Oscillospiraceae bacterium]|nr:hypothetical protein [Oscillospiraceae bacterium]